MRRRKLALVAAASLAAMTMLSTAPALAATKPTTPASPVQAPNGVKFDPSKAKCSTVTDTSGSTKHCLQIARLPLSDLTATQRTERQQAMTKLSAKGKQAQASAAAPAAAPAAPAAPAGCAFGTTSPTANPARLLSCSDFAWTAIDWEEIAGVLVPDGTFPFEDQSWVTFSSKSLSWVHDMQTISYTGMGSLSGGVGGLLSSNCTVVPTICSATSAVIDPQAVSLTNNSTHSWEWNETDQGPALTTTGAVDNLDSALGVQWNIVAGTNSVIEQETGGLYARCDNGVARGKTMGCNSYRRSLSRTEPPGHPLT